MLVISTLVNFMRTHVLALINNVAVVAEVLGCLILIVLFLTHNHHPPRVFLHTYGAGAGVQFGVFGCLLISSFVGVYQFLASDEAASLAEEAPDPRRRAPIAMLQAYAGTMVLGIIVLGTAILAIPNLHDPNVAALGLPYILTTIAGATWGRVVLALVFFAVFGCCLAVQAAGARMVFAMARDGRLPFSRQLSTVSHTSKSVPVAGAVIGGIAIALLAINIGATQIVSTLTSSAVAFCLVAYLCLSGAMLAARRRGEWPLSNARTEGLFTLGRWGMPLNVAMVIWTAALLINTLWPRASVYNAVPPFHWYLRYAPLIFTVGFTAIGLVYYGLNARHRSGIDRTLYETSTPEGPPLAVSAGAVPTAAQEA
jgi:amino acid transporter